MTDDEHAPITLDEAARLFPDGSVTAKTLGLRIRQGKLKAYKPGKKYLTTAADVRDMIEACRVKPTSGGSRPPDTVLNIRDSTAALDAALASVRGLKKRR